MSKILKKIIIFFLSVCVCIYGSNLPSVAAIKGLSSLESKAVNSLSPSAIAAMASRDCQEIGSTDRQPELAKKIVHYMRSKGYSVSTGEKEYNIIYLEGSCANGVPNADEPDYFNDRRILLEFVNGEPSITNNWSATSEPGQKYTDKPLKPQGAARIAFGQYKNVWYVGEHSGVSANVKHEGLIQDGNVTIYRDKNKNGKRDAGDLIQTGNFALNQHRADGNPEKRIKGWSAGCLVGWRMEGHQKFMAILKGDSRYQKNRKYHFTTTIINGDKFAEQESINSEPVSEPATSAPVTSEPATSDGE
jgi:hypothetical protein